MSLSKDGRAYNDVRLAFDEALRAENGINIVCKNRAEAFHLRSRFNMYRTITRNQSREVYLPDDPHYNRSPYEELICRIPPESSPNSHILYIEPRVTIKFSIEVNPVTEKLSTENRK